METGDLCPYCMRPGCPGIACGRDLMAAQTVSEARTAEEAPLALCGFCYGAGGYRVPCHACQKVGP